MADIERLVVSKIISTGRVQDAVSRGVIADHFADEQCQNIYSYILSHVNKYSTPPTAGFIKMRFKDFELLHTEDSLKALVDEFVTRVKVRKAKQLVLDLADIADQPEYGDEIDLKFLEASRELATVLPSSSVHKFVGDMRMRQQEYKERKKANIPVGIPFGFPTLDAWTSGLKPHQFAVVSGFTGLGKSTLLSVFAFNFWIQGKTPLFITLEMGADELAAKWDAMAADLDYGKLNKMHLTDEEIKNWEKKCEEILGRSSDVADIPVIDSIRSCTPEHVFAETVRYKPDVVIVDYIQLMRSARPNRGSSQWQSITEITQDLKQNARTLRIPVLAAAQTNREGGKSGSELDNIGNSISISQDPDIVLGLYQNEEMESDNLIEIRVNKNRGGQKGRFMSHWNHERLYYSEYDPSRPSESLNVFKRRNGNDSKKATR